jgi:ABC-type multidrug transport system fused ATPase/permease subunit
MRSSKRPDFFYLQQQLPSWIACQLSNIVLALVSAAIGALIGPTLFLMVRASEPFQVSFEQLLGAFWGSQLSAWSGQGSIPSTVLFEYLPFLLCGLAAARMLASGLQSVIWEGASERVAWTLRSELFQNFVERSPYALGEADAELAGVLANDIKTFREYFVHYFGSLPREVLQLVIYFGMLFTYSIEMTLLFLVGIAPISILVSRLGKKLRRRAEAALGDFSQLSEWLQLRLNGIETIKHFRTESLESEKFWQRCTSLYKVMYKALRVKSRSGPLMELVATIAVSVVFYVAFLRIQNGQLSGAVQMSFFATLALISQAGGRLGKYLNSNREGVVAMIRIRQTTDQLRGQHRSELATGRELLSQADKPILAIAGLSYAYPDTKDLALKNFSYEFLPGRVYCVVGHSGSGKSTLLRLILGLLAPKQGTIRQKPAARLGFVPQAVQLAPVSIAENIAYPKFDVDRERVGKSLKAVDLDKWIQSIEGRGDTSIAGHGLSGGQAQRISLARMWYHEYDIVLIDEGTSAADPETERKLIQSMRDLALKGCCVITIAHRQAVVAAADDVIIMVKGESVASGAYRDIQKTPQFCGVFG